MRRHRHAPQRWFGGFRRAGVCVALALAVGLVPVAAQQADAAGTHTLEAAHRASDAPARLPDIARSGGATPLVVASRPAKQRHLGLDDLTLLAIFVAGLGGDRRRLNLHTGERFRFDARFATRRGPPLLLPAC